MVYVAYHIANLVKVAERLGYVSGYGEQFGPGEGRSAFTFEAAPGRRNAVSHQFMVLVQRDSGHEIALHEIMLVVDGPDRPGEFYSGPGVIG